MLEIRNLNVSYGPIQALHGVSLAVGEREAVAVLGANGAGKSTLIKTIIGWERPAAGEILFDGQPVHRLAPWQRLERGIALVPESGHVFRDMSVLDNLRLGGYLQPEAVVRQQLDAVYALFPVLAQRRGQQARTLSGGEQQMVAIGRALMSRPRLLLIDEVSMGLMPILVRKVFEVIGQLRTGGVAILLVEQNAFEALKVVDRGYVLENGHIVLSDAAAALSQNPRVKAAYLGG